MEFCTKNRAERERDNVGIDRQANLAEYCELEFAKAPRSQKHLHLHIILARWLAAWHAPKWFAPDNVILEGIEGIKHVVGVRASKYVISYSTSTSIVAP